MLHSPLTQHVHIAVLLCVDALQMLGMHTLLAGVYLNGNCSLYFECYFIHRQTAISLWLFPAIAAIYFYQAHLKKADKTHTIDAVMCLHWCCHDLLSYCSCHAFAVTNLCCLGSLAGCFFATTTTYMHEKITDANCNINYISITAKILTV